MSRGLHSTLQTELATDHLDQIHLIKFSIGGTTYFRTTGYFDIEYDSNTYTASGDVLGVPSIRESSSLNTSEVDFTITSVSQAFLSLFLNNNHIHQPVTIYRAYLTDAGALVTNPYTYFVGYISGYSVNETKTSSQLSIKIANHWSNFQMKKGRRTNNNSQQILFSGDKFFEFTTAIISDIEWGKTNDQQ
jgi:hypothetical protein